MVERAQEILPINIEDELKQSYLDYAMSVIVGRALPDVRDGLKPVHRRVLYAMSQLGNDWNRAYKKSARIVGDVIGKYHPHGDTAVYDAIVRMAQSFSLRYLLVDGQGNFGSIDGDNPAAMRYTEVRMTKIAHELLADLDKDTVDFGPNYDDTEQMPTVLPARVPQLLVNGSSGIAVGMATNIPPHNLGEVLDACLLLIDNPVASIEDLMQYIQGPDFPTAGIINGRAGIIQAYRTGRGRIYMRARAQVEEQGNKSVIIVTEIPYQVNKARLIEKIAELVKEKKIEGITELRDESDKDGMRIVIELRRGEVGEVILNNLYAQTQLENVFGINIVALVDGQPRILSLKQVLQEFIAHRQTVITRRSIFLLNKVRNRAHILEGLAIAITNIDPIIALIKASSSAVAAKEALLSQSWPLGDVAEMLQRAQLPASATTDIDSGYGQSKESPDNYYLSPAQAQAILDLRLQKLTGMEHDKLLNEYEACLTEIIELQRILADRQRLIEVMKEELVTIREQYNDERLTEIVHSKRDLTAEDLIPEEQVVLTISHSGYGKIQPIDVYRAQRRGGRGKAATAVKEEDFVQHLLAVGSHDMILCFTDRGKVYWLKAFHIPQAGRNARGKPLVNVLSMAADEKITAVLPLKEVAEAKYVFMATSQGTVKKLDLQQLLKPRNSGLVALGLNEGDTLVGAALTDGNQKVLLCSSEGKAIRFHEEHVRVMGRTACGVRGMKLGKGHRVISLIIGHEDQDLLVVSANGYGKRTKVSEFPLRGRSGQGVIAMLINQRNGAMVGAVQVIDQDDILLISDQGTLVRTRVDEIRQMGRSTQGVTLIKLSSNEHLVGVERVEEFIQNN